MDSIIKDSYTEPTTYSLAFVATSQGAEQVFDDPNDAPHLWTFIHQKPSTASWNV